MRQIFSSTKTALSCSLVLVFTLRLVWPIKVLAVYAVNLVYRYIVLTSLWATLMIYIFSDSPGGGGGYFLVKDYWGCAAGWGRIFTTGLNIMGLHF